MDKWHKHGRPADEPLSGTAAIEKEPGDATPVADWVRTRLGIEPDEAQTRMLNLQAKCGVVNCTRQWGKSTIGAAKAIHLAMTEPESLIVVASPTTRQSGELVRKAQGFVGKLGMRARGDGSNPVSIALPNGSRIVGLPGREGTIRGFSAVKLVLIDEASRVHDDVYLAIRPMLATSKGSLWLMSTPWGKRGFFWDVWERGGSEWERIRVPASECARIPAEFLAREKKGMGARWFRQEFCCEFNDRTSAVFDLETIKRAMTDKVKPLDLFGPKDGQEDE